jgi:NAD(P)H-flavin reductase/ferredoxin
MRQLVSITIDGKSFSAYPGDILLDAALRNGIGLPHDCQVGDCGTCNVRILSGRTLGGDADGPDIVHACKARVLSDIEATTGLEVATSKLQGRVAAIAPLCEGMSEIVIELPRRFPVRAGQYVYATFSGLPARAYCPTSSLDPRLVDGRIRFQVAHHPGGLLSEAFGKKIQPGHRVTIEGPHGQAYLRRGETDRLILVSEGTGFAPMWAIADAALRERPDRSILMITGVCSIEQVYMAPALDMMAACPNVRILMTTERRQSMTPIVLAGRPVDYLPPMLSRDIVFAAGSTALVAAVEKTAAVSGARFCGEPFLPSGTADRPGWLQRVFSRRGTAQSETPPPLPGIRPRSLTARLQGLAPTLKSTPSQISRTPRG